MEWAAIELDSGIDLGLHGHDLMQKPLIFFPFGFKLISFCLKKCSLLCPIFSEKANTVDCLYKNQQKKRQQDADQVSRDSF